LPALTTSTLLGQGRRDGWCGRELQAMRICCRGEQARLGRSGSPLLPL